jgi:hypothetical protein
VLRSRPVLAIVFFLLVTPVGLVLRVLRDPLRRRRQREVASYWEPLTL